ncbi:hypothetical protein B0H19DRAFT_1262722 [Mycena capillaripes]|nr:hypothetical protein B0H19DRAFT_1262722 [Mycena capillaripes]
MFFRRALYILTRKLAKITGRTAQANLKRRAIMTPLIDAMARNTTSTEELMKFIRDSKNAYSNTPVSAPLLQHDVGLKDVYTMLAWLASMAMGPQCRSMREGVQTLILLAALHRTISALYQYASIPTTMVLLVVRSLDGGRILACYFGTSVGLSTYPNGTAKGEAERGRFDILADTIQRWVPQGGLAALAKHLMTLPTHKYMAHPGGCGETMPTTMALEDISHRFGPKCTLEYIALSSASLAEEVKKNLNLLRDVQSPQKFPAIFQTLVQNDVFTPFCFICQRNGIFISNNSLSEI